MRNKTHLQFFYFTPIAIVWGFYFVLFSSAPHAHALNSVYQVLTPDSSGNFSGYGAMVAQIWRSMMNLVNSLVILALIAVAFANILRYQLDSYAVKKFLPTFIMAVILANFSFLISRIVIDFGNMVMSLFLFGNTQNNITGAFDTLIGKNPIGPKGYEGNYIGYILGYSFKQLMVIAGAVLVLILAFIFIIRNYLIYFLVAIAPLGFMAMVLPVTKKYFQMWWSNFTKWVFMPVVSLFWLWLAGQFMSVVETSETGGPWFMTLAFAGLCFYMAITTPFKLGGVVMGAWAGWGKKAWGATGGQAVKGGKWVVGGGAASYGQSYYQAKAKLAKSLGRTDEEKKWTKKANVYAAVNPQTYKKAIQERIAFGRGAAEKAVVKSELYNRVVGPAKQIDAIKESTAPDWRDASATEAGIGGGGIIKKINSSSDDRVKDLRKRHIEEADKINAQRVAAGQTAWSDADRDKHAYHSELAFIRNADSTTLAQIFGGADKFEKLKDVAEMPNIAGAFSRRSGGQFVEERDEAFNAASGLNLPIGRPRRAAGPRGAAGAAAQPLTPEEENARRLQERFGVAPAATATTAAGPTGAPGAPGAPPGTTSSAIPVGPEAVTVKNMEDFTNALQDILNQLGIKDQVGEKDLSDFTNAIAKMKPGDITPDSLGIAFARLGTVNVRVTDVDPAAMTKLTNSAKAVARESQRWETALQVKSSDIWNRVLRILGQKANPETVKHDAEEGIGLIGKGTEKEE